ncbi:MAG: OmpA family protein [Saprospiraceae bacterium]|nr:OmpA family protein [Saprospiraceae bacterium]
MLRFISIFLVWGSTVLVASIPLGSCVGAGKYKDLLEEKTLSEAEMSDSVDKLKEVNQVLSERNQLVSSELVRQNTLLSEILNDKLNLDNQVKQLQDQIKSLSSESKTLAADLNEELQQKNENLKLKEAKLNRIINWQLQKEAELQNISTLLGQEMTGYSENQIEWFFSDHLLSIVLYKEFLTANDRSLSPPGETALAKVGQILSSYPSLVIVVEGHTDNSVSEVLEALKISTNRAILVSTYLLDESGLNGNQISVAGVGAYQPRMSNQTPAGRALNNRVEIKVSSRVQELWSLMEK